MRPFRVVSYTCALWLFAMAAVPVQAGWHNVFQVCCHSCGSRPVVSYYAAPDPCCNPCPQVCTTRYVQRCYYQPVTSYETRSFYEAVTSYRTSYYYEPVTTVRYSSYYDACTCSYYQVPCTSTSYQLRSQSCPVQSWVQRCYSQPVTTYRQCAYWEPVTSCTNPCAVPAMPAPAVPMVPATTEPPPAAAQPGVNEGRIQPQAPQPAIRENRGINGSGSPLIDQTYPRGTSHQMPNTAGSSLRPQQLPVRPPAPTPVQNVPNVRLEQIVSIPGNAADVKLASAVDAPKWTPKR